MPAGIYSRVSFGKYIKQKFGNRAQLCFTDTDSFLYVTQSDDVYAETSSDRDLFDFQIILQIKKKLRKFKDECGANVIQDLVGLRSKLNCYRV